MELACAEGACTPPFFGIAEWLFTGDYNFGEVKKVDFGIFLGGIDGKG